jgi:hypothetical protein
MFMIPRRAIRKTASLLALDLPICPKTGFVLCVGFLRASSLRSDSGDHRDARHGGNTIMKPTEELRAEHYGILLMLPILEKVSMHQVPARSSH